jgi:synaptobrevin family protein YKT6
VANRGGLVAIMFADREYPSRAAFSVLQKARARMRVLAQARHVRALGVVALPVALTPSHTHAFAAPKQTTDDFLEQFGERWRQNTADTPAGDELVGGALMKYQDPAAADKLLQIQRELDETKVVLHKTIDSVLARGEKLDNLVEKSSDLSMASQMFYKQAKKVLVAHTQRSHVSPPLRSF